MFKVSVEGNIGAGKTTFLNIFKNDPRVKVIKEPVSMWKDVNGSNLLQLMYENGQRWNFAFQSRVQQTMLEGHLTQTDRSVKLMERSLHSTREIFMKHQVKFGTIQKVETDILEGWYNFLTANDAFNTTIDLYVYLRTDPETAFERLRKRNRKEEHKVSMNYIKEIHARHEEWLGENSPPKNTPVLILNANKSEDDIKEMALKVDDIITGTRKLSTREVIKMS